MLPLITSPHVRMSPGGIYPVGTGVAVGVYEGVVSTPEAISQRRCSATWSSCRARTALPLTFLPRKTFVAASPKPPKNDADSENDDDNDDDDDDDDMDDKRRRPVLVAKSGFNTHCGASSTVLIATPSDAAYPFRESAIASLNTCGAPG